MRYVPYDYQPGGVWGICDRCGFKYRLSELRHEWTGLKVCREDWDERPADMTPPYLYPEGVPIPDSRPDPAPIYNNLPLGPVVDRLEENSVPRITEDGVTRTLEIQ